ncbi:MAG: UDP-N-acetylmuramate--L-alanine ligase [Chitinophagaceae bacterium]|nr:UDP-N-acetylmuramate--L-alanine ligase [Oligoflexus sp.]
MAKQVPLHSSSSSSILSSRRLHLIGIGGTGMRPLAEIAHLKGFHVSGSDQSRSTNVERLIAAGIPVAAEHTAANLPPKPCEIIISSAIKADNPELKAACEQGYSIVHRSDLLKLLMVGKKAICVSGTHGKTSTTAMLAYMLHALELDPTAAIGGELVGLEKSSFVGSGDYFVAECDESDGSFLKYDPFISIVTNIDLDHLDHYGDIEGLKKAFLSFIQKTDKDGCAVVGWDNPIVRELMSSFSGSKLAFGTRMGSEVRGTRFTSHGRTVAYEAVVDKTLVASEAALVGKHNFQNILCCLAVANVLELDLAAAALALSHYPGVGRRFSLMAEYAGVKIYDDYAHNPGKIRSCIEGARSAFPSERILIIFQPHRYSRLETMYNEFMQSFGAADEVFVLPVYAAGETSTRDFSPARVAKDIQDASKVRASKYETDVLKARLSHQQSPTVLITIGAGDVWRLSQEWKEFLHGPETQTKDPSIEPKA